MKVLVAIDGSPSSLRAIKYVTKHADVFGAKPNITLIAVHLPVPSLLKASNLNSRLTALPVS